MSSRYETELRLIDRVGPEMAEQIYGGELSKALARVAELEKDKERLDWLHSHWGRFIACAGPDLSGFRLRDAVDMAMKGVSK